MWSSCVTAPLIWPMRALWSAARDHSIDSAPLLIFATVGTVLTLVMLKT